MHEILMTIVKSVNWGEVLTSVIQTCMYLMIPIFIELTTGVLRTTSKYLEANKANSWLIHLMSDVATVMDAQWQLEAKDIREKWDSGELSREDWEKQKQHLRESFRTKMLEKLQKYPVAYAKQFEDELEDHMEAWLAQNKKIEAATKTLQNTTVQSPEIAEALSKVTKNTNKVIKKLKTVKK